MALLEVRGLSIEFSTAYGPLRAVRDVSFAVETGEIMGLVGESGSGKTVTCRALLRLLPSRLSRISSGEILYQGTDLLRLGERDMRKVRGAEIAMIFQNPSSHLDPVMTVGDQIAEAAIVHDGLSRAAGRGRAVELLRQVGIPEPEQALFGHPHQFSGGMRQRAMIAAALACRPKLLIADEPTTALDVTVQAQILRLLLDLRDSTGLAIVLITHNLGIVAETCDSVAVMYGGRIVERAPTAALLKQPLHPYTAGLIRSQPELAVRNGPLPTIEGQPPALASLPPGCAFHPRCAYAADECRRAEPELQATGAGRANACLRWPLLAGRAEARA